MSLLPAADLFRYLQTTQEGYLQVLSRLTDASLTPAVRARYLATPRVQQALRDAQTLPVTLSR